MSRQVEPQLLIPVSAAQALANYLVTKPYQEVNGFVQMLQGLREARHVWPDGPPEHPLGPVDEMAGVTEDAGENN